MKQHYIDEFYNQHDDQFLLEIERLFHVYETRDLDTGEFYIGSSTWNWDKRPRNIIVYSGSYTYEPWLELKDQSNIRKRILAYGFESKEECLDFEYKIIDAVFDNPLNVNKSNPANNFYTDNSGKNNSWYGRKRPEHSKFLKKYWQINTHPSTGKTPSTKGKTLEEIYGEEMAVEIKEKISKNIPDMSGENNPMHGRNHPNKGKTLEEICGEERARKIKDEASKRITEQNKKYGNPMTGMTGSLNPSAKKVIRFIDNKIYYSVKECIDDNNISYSAFYYQINKAKNKKFGYIEE